MISYDELKHEIEKIVDSGYNRQLGEVEGLKKLVIGPTGVVEVEVALKDVGGKEEINFKIELTRLVKLTYEFPGIKINVVRNTFVPEGVKAIKYIGIASGKGGVGKSTVTANLAYALVRLGKKVGIIDADVYGATIADIYEIPDAKPTGTSVDKMKPPLSKGVEIMSTAFFVEKGKPVMWRGPMLGKLLNSYFHGVEWDSEIDYVLVDLPPGTGDTALDVQQFAPQTKMLVVTTPHINASSVALKAGHGARRIGHELIGVVENMSYYLNPVNNKKDFVFGSGGGNIVSEELGVNLLSQIPLNQPANGFLYEENEPIGKIYNDLAEQIIKLME